MTARLFRALDPWSGKGVEVEGSLLCDCGDKLSRWDWRRLPRIRSAIIETISFHYLLLVATLRCNAGKTSTPNKTKTEMRTKTNTMTKTKIMTNTNTMTKTNTLLLAVCVLQQG